MLTKFMQTVDFTAEKNSVFTQVELETQDSSTQIITEFNEQQCQCQPDSADFEIQFSPMLFDATTQSEKEEKEKPVEKKVLHMSTQSEVLTDTLKDSSSQYESFSTDAII